MSMQAATLPPPARSDGPQRSETSRSARTTRGLPPRVVPHKVDPLMARPAGSVFARHVRWGVLPDDQKRVRLADAARPVGLVFSTVNWTGKADGPTDHQQGQTVDAVFGAFNWT